MAMSFNFVLSNNPQGGSIAGTEKESSSGANNNSSQDEASIITSTDQNCVDGFAGKDIMGTFDESKLTPAIMAGVETAGSIACNAETAGSIAYGAETAGSIAFSGAETAGSVASSDSGGGSFGGDGGFTSVG